MHFAPVYPWLYQILKPTFPSCLWSGSQASNTIALTFDDGPHPNYTQKLLEVLAKYSVQGNFFWLGRCVERYQQTAREVYQQGHWLGLHGYTHQSFPTLSREELHKNLQENQNAIFTALELDKKTSILPTSFLRDVRPPNGLFTPRTLQLLQQWNYRPVMWSVVPEDWVAPGVNTVVQRVLKQVRNGSVIVLHDGNLGGEDVSRIVAELVPPLLDQGYQFVSLEQFWQQKLG